MLLTSEVPTESLIKTLRALVEDLSNKHSPFNKDEAYLRNLAGWIACAATRIESMDSILAPKEPTNNTEKKDG